MNSACSGGKDKKYSLTFLSWIRLGLAKKSDSACWLMIYGLSVLTGIGFTMSLFVDSLTFEGMKELYGSADRLAILIGSVLSAVVRYLVLKFAIGRAPETDTVVNKQSQ